MSLLQLNFSNETAVKIDQKAVEQTLSLILRRLNYPDTVNIELVVVGDNKIKQLNHNFRKIDASTDVLSFSSSNEPEDGSVGSIVISVDTAAKQAKQAGIELIDEVKLLAGHGFLHLLGFHHS